jgi:hypothetical protein
VSRSNSYYLQNFVSFHDKNKRPRGHVTVTAESISKTASVAVCGKDA